MTRRRPRAGRVVLVAALLLVAGVAALVLFFPAAAVKAQFESQVSRATGYAVTTQKLGLGFAGLGLGLRVGDLRAESADGGQTIEIPDLDVQVAILPLFRKQIVIRRLNGRGAVLALNPPTRMPPAPTAAPGGGEPAALVAPSIELTGSRIIQNGVSGTTTLDGVTLTASFRSAAGGGRLDGRFGADSTKFAPKATPDRPLVLPAIDAAFGSDVTFAPVSATTRVEGTVGRWPLHGSVSTSVAPEGTKNSGDFDFDPASIEVLKGLVTGQAAAQIAVYQLGGSLESGRLHFETFPGREEMDYLFTARWTGARASLPDKGKVVDDGTLALELHPDILSVAGDLVLGASNLNLKARVENFAKPAWTADTRIKGPAADALRFLPPNADLDVRSGDLDLDLHLAGVAGRAGLPDASGSIRLLAMAFTHKSVAEPIERLDLSARLDGTSLTIESGAVRAAGSDASFTGRLDDFRKPNLNLNVTAGTVDFGRLFPERKGEGASTSAPPAKPDAAVPVSGRITIDRLLRDRLSMTGVAATFSVAAGGVDLTNITGTAYGGAATGELHLKPAGPDRWDYDGDFLLDSMQAEDLFEALTPIRGIEGVIRTGFRVSGRNGSGIDPLQTLTMRGAGILFDGSILNIPAVRKLSEALDLKGFPGDRIPIQRIKHRFRVEDGFVLMDTMEVAQPSGDWKIGGRIAFDGRLDCPISTRLAADMFESGTELRKLADLLADSEGRLPVSLRLSGTLTSPDVSVDVDPLLEAAKEKAKDSLADELRKRLDRWRKKN